MAILHVFHSEARQILMDYVRQIGRFSIERYIDNVTERTGITRHDKEIMTRFYTAGIVGVWTDWVEDNMESDSPAQEIVLRRRHNSSNDRKARQQNMRPGFFVFFYFLYLQNLFTCIICDTAFCSHSGLRRSG